ncbi:hypothetical protein EXIGLDRAFT_784669 [Exidia glandulosa HHB12029]|uniref:Uncharacterized protein n=1 Tax=Exidia glandulosa HHB12029 TaxID=1314781 RepID=A0A166MBY0_EXIGL|nr:hypothetical protein EXIGLDRAFT_784669 [Exidia glandulosa HHB12029]
MHMQAHPEKYLVIDTSAVIQDRDGNTLVSMLGLDGAAVERVRRTMRNPTDAEVFEAVRNMDMSHSPILPEVMDDFMQKTKTTLNVADYAPDSGTNSRHKPNKDGRLPRHYGTYKLSDAFVRELRKKQAEHVLPGYTPAPFETEFRETATTCHYMQAWHQSGHRDQHDMTPSADIWGNSRVGVGHRVQAYHLQTSVIRRILRDVAEVTMSPEQFARYHSAFKAGRMFKDAEGIFLGQVTVSNALSYTHADSLDGKDGVCMSFSSYGHRGTMIIFPDLGTILRYDPTDLCVFRSAELMHFVTDWEATPMGPRDIVTPGRTAAVFLTPSATLRDLDGKRPDSFRNSGGGLFTWTEL